MIKTTFIVLTFLIIGLVQKSVDAAATYSIELQQLNPNQYTMLVGIGKPLQWQNMLMDQNYTGIFMFNDTMKDLENGYFKCSDSDTCANQSISNVSYSNAYFSVRGEQVRDYLSFGDQGVKNANIILATEITTFQYTNLTNVSGVIGIGPGSYVMPDKVELLGIKITPEHQVWNWSPSYTYGNYQENSYLFVNMELQQSSNDSAMLSSDSETLQVVGRFCLIEADYCQKSNQIMVMYSQYIGLTQSYFSFIQKYFEVNTTLNVATTDQNGNEDGKLFLYFPDTLCQDIPTTELPTFLFMHSEQFTMWFNLSVPMTPLLTNYNGSCFTMFYNTQLDDERTYLGTTKKL